MFSVWSTTSGSFHRDCGHWRVFVHTLLCLLACIVSAVAIAAESRHLAFVVGIDHYDNLPADQQQLTRAVRDATDVRQSLINLGFEVVSGTDLSRDQFTAKWKEFVDAVNPNDTVAIFLSGHGMEIEGENYILTKNAPYRRFGRQSELKRESILLTELVLDVQARKPRLVLMIVDACRTNPFVPPEYSGAGNRGTSITGDGVLVLYSAGGNEPALDRFPGFEDINPNSVFGRVLLPLLGRSTLASTPLYLAWSQKVQKDVRELAAKVGHKQTPKMYSGLEGEFCLLGPCESPKRPSAPQTGTGIGGYQGLEDTACVAWPLIRTTNSEQALLDFIEASGESPCSRRATERLEVLRQDRSPRTDWRRQPAAEINPWRAVASTSASNDRVMRDTHSLKDIGTNSTRESCAARRLIESATSEDALLDFVAAARGSDCSRIAARQLQIVTLKRSEAHVISVGINRVEDATLGSLRYAVTDAQRVSGVLKRSLNLIYKGTNVYELSDRAASKANILATFRKVRDTAAPGDTVLIYLSGYAVNVEGRPYFVPADAKWGQPTTYIDLTEIQTWMLRTFGRRILLIDSCGFELSGPIKETLVDGPRGDQITILTAAAVHQAAFESSDIGGSYFAAALTRTLLDANSDGRDLTLEEWGEAVTWAVRTMSGGRQHPYFATNDGQLFMAVRPSRGR